MATFTNQATLTYNGQTTTSNVTVGELVETLTAAKTAVVPTYDPDGRVTYVISLVNSGAAPLAGLTVTDDLGGYTFNGATVYPQLHRRLRALLPERRFADRTRRYRRSSPCLYRHHRARRRQCGDRV